MDCIHAFAVNRTGNLIKKLHNPEDAIHFKDMVSSKAVGWDDESTALYEDDWDVVTHLSAATCSVEACSQTEIVGRRLRLRGESQGVKAYLKGKGKYKWNAAAKVAISLIIMAIMMVSTVSIRAETRMTQATASSFQHKKVLTSDMLTGSYHKSGFATTMESLGESGLPKSLEHLADVSRGPPDSTDVPFFFHVPRSGGGSVKDILGRCYGLVEATDSASHMQGPHRPASLDILYSDDGQAYVNVDTSTTEGIQEARSIGLVESGLANVVASQHLHPAATLFNENQKGRCFTMIRHPIERAVSMFHHLAVANWEPTYDPSLAYISIEMYARSKRAEHNWLVRFLSSELDGDLTDEHLAIAKEVLSQKCLVGLLHRKEESFHRFEQYFGWVSKSKIQTDCRNRLLQWGWSNKHSHPEVEVGSVVWDLLSKENSYDMKLYHFARTLFADQARLFESEGGLAEQNETVTVSIEGNS